jgi:membrane protease YdiL (CAAX protease family)
MAMRKIFQVVRPILLSAFALLVVSICTQQGMQFFMPHFQLLASKDLGKIIFTTLAFGAIALFIAQQPAAFRAAWVKRNLLFLTSRIGLRYFTGCFALFFFLHCLFLAICYTSGHGALQTVVNIQPFTLTGKLIFGFFVTFMLALTEEIIFRGTFYPYFVAFMRPIWAVLATSLLFMIVHFLPNPISQLYADWPVGLGLFLLGFMLNLIFIKAGSMYANIGTHAGLVYVKVILRKIRFFVFAPLPTLPWILHTDLRQAPIVHILFASIIIYLIISQRAFLFAKSEQRN